MGAASTWPEFACGYLLGETHVFGAVKRLAEGYGGYRSPWPQWAREGACGPDAVMVGLLCNMHHDMVFLLFYCMHLSLGALACYDSSSHMLFTAF